MKSFLKSLFTYLLSIHLLSLIIPSVVLPLSFINYCYAVIIYVILFKITRPFLNILILPLNLVTLNLTSWILNIILFYLWIVLTPGVSVSKWTFEGLSLGIISLSSVTLQSWQVIILSAILLFLVVKFISWLIKS